MCDVTPSNDNNNEQHNNNSNADAAPPPANIELSASVLAAYHAIAQARAILAYELHAQPIAGIGENSFGVVFQVKLTPTRTLPTFVAVPPVCTILKTAPKNAARRAHMRAVDIYAREVFMYEIVFGAYADMQAELLAEGVEVPRFVVAPQLLHASLQPANEFLIVEDLMQAGYTQNSRTKMPTYDLVVCNFKAIAQLHAMSFVLQARKPTQFKAIVAQMGDNLFTPQMDEVSVEFGKKYVRRTRHMLEEEQRQGKHAHAADLLRLLHKVEDHFKDICLKAVNGAECAPYAVVCHGDFWNNNILYQYDSNHQAHTAKLIDFQLSRYASPVLDLVHYLYACTEQELRAQYFDEFLKIYYDTLTQIIRAHRLDPSVLYPEAVFQQQLRDFGYYGFCMAAFSIPFFISNISEFPDLDQVSEAIQELSSSSDNSDAEEENNNKTVIADVKNSHVKTEKTPRELVDEYDLLTERTVPIFKRRMIGIVDDLLKYNMADKVLLY